MEFIPVYKKARHLDFTRPTFNEPNIQLPESIEAEKSRLPSTFADNEESTNDFETTEAQKAAKQTENINVHLRLRPIKQEPCSSYKFNENTVIIPEMSVNTERHFKFTSVLNDSVSQREVYDEILRPVLTKPFDLKGATFSGYGVSNSGKTYTILGDESAAGLVPRAITQIFNENYSVIDPFPRAKIISDQISILSDQNVEYEMDMVNEFLSVSNKLNKGKSSSKMWSHEEIQHDHDFREKTCIENPVNRLYIWISFVEIYNEKITDLLNIGRTTTRPLKIFSNSGNSYIHGATWLFAANIETAFNILKSGLNRIKYAVTGINDHSSRSHSILTINMIAESGMDFQFSSFKFCDLAGAERLKKTGNIGDRLKEAGTINNSLLVLGRCLEAVQQNQNKTNKKLPDHVVPVRDSKLTFLLQSSLLGHEKFVMIVNLCPTADFLEENLNVLKFGSIANQIVVRKSEVRTFKRQSSRYSYLLHHPSMLNSSLRNESVINEENENDESELDDSFKWSSMNNQELREELHFQKRMIEELNKLLIEREKESAENRMQILEAQKKIQENIAKRNDEDTAHLKQYYEKKMENQKIKYERLLNDAQSEIDHFYRIMRKCSCEARKELEMEEVEDESGLSDEEDVIEID